MRFDEKISFGDDILLELLHRVVVFSAVAPDEVHFAERATADDPQQLEIIKADFLVRAQKILTCALIVAPSFSPSRGSVGDNWNIVVDSLAHDFRSIFIHRTALTPAFVLGWHI